MVPKNLKIPLGLIVDFFFGGYLSTRFFMLMFIYSSKFIAIKKWFASTCFFNIIIPLLLKKKKLNLSLTSFFGLKANIARLIDFS